MVDQNTASDATKEGEEEEIGGNENYYARMAADFDAWFANVKRTYDEYQQESLETTRQMRLLFTKQVSDAQQYDNQRQQIANHALELAVTRDNQAIQNTLESQNMTAKQVIRETDLLMYGVTPAQEAMATAIASKVVSAMGGTPVNTTPPSTGS